MSIRPATMHATHAMKILLNYFHEELSVMTTLTRFTRWKLQMFQAVGEIVCIMIPITIFTYIALHHMMQ